MTQKKQVLCGLQVFFNYSTVKLPSTCLTQCNKIFIINFTIGRPGFCEIMPAGKEGTVMPRGSEELTNSRKNEIISACARLYETMSFKEITLKEIGKETSFTRTSIYNYFQTKEEIFLALFQREYEAWIKDLEMMYRQNERMSVDEFAGAIAHTLEKRERLLKLLAMNHYDMEAASRMENLIDFKKAYRDALRAVSCCLEKFFPKMTVSDIQEFIYAFFPFLFGVYPYTVVTEKQKEAMDAAGVNYLRLSIYEIVDSMVKKLLYGVRIEDPLTEDL